MTAVLWPLRLAVATPLRSVGLRRLFRITAAGFGRPLPRLSWHYDRLLEQYGAFTAAAARETLELDDDAGAIRERLGEAAFAGGERLRRWLRLRHPSEAMSAATSLYRCIGIDLKGDTDGTITVRRCYLSALYSPEVCGLMAALDEGMLAGLHGGGRLRFEQRITDGSACCLARLDCVDEGSVHAARHRSR